MKSGLLKSGLPKSGSTESRLRETLTGYSFAIRGPRAVSLIGCAIATLFSIQRTVVSGFVSDLDNPSISKLILSGMVAGAGLSLVMLIAHLTVLRHRFERLMPLWLVLVVYACASVAGGVLQGAASQFLNVGSGPSPGRVILAMLLFATTAILLSVRDDRLLARQRLWHEQRRLVKLRDLTASEISRLRAALTDLAIDEILPAITHISLRLQGAGRASSGALHEIATAIRDCAHTVVRQLSHSLINPESSQRVAFSTEPDDDADAAPTRFVVRRRELFAFAVNEKPIRPLIFTLTVLAVAGPLGGPVDKPLVLVAAMVSAGLILLACQQIWCKLPSLPIAARVIILVLMYALAAVIPSYALWADSAGAVPLVLVQPVMTACFLLIAAIWALIAAYFAARDHALRDLEITVAAVRWQASQLESEERALRHEISGILHSNVQSRLAALAMKLDVAADDLTRHHDIEQTTAITAQALTTLNATAEEIRSLASARDSKQYRSLDETLTQVVLTWEALVVVTIQIDQSTRVALNAVPSAIQIIGEITNDIATNAARHGKASTLDIAISADGGDLVINADDNGIGFEDPRPGFGFNRLTLLGGSWKLASMPTGTHLTITIPGQSLGMLTVVTPDFPKSGRQAS